MYAQFLSILIVLLFWSSSLFAQSAAPQRMVRENYYGQTVEDPYRYMEKLDDPFVKNWFREQSMHARQALDQISRRRHLIDLQMETENKAGVTVSQMAFTKNGKYFYLKADAKGGAAKLYFRKSLNAEEQELFDPAGYKSVSKQEYVINYIQPDWKGEKLVISLTKNGEEISEMLVFDMKSRKTIPDLLIENCWPSDGGGVSWLPDNSGFVYLHYPETDPRAEGFLKNMKAVVYKIGKDPKQLNEIFSKTHDPELGMQAHDFPIVSLQAQDDRYAVGGVYGGTPYGDTYYAPVREVAKGRPDWKPLYKKEDKVAHYLMDGESIVYMTATNSSRYQICKTSLQKPDFAHPEVLAEAPDEEVITGFTLAKGQLFFASQKNGVEARFYTLTEGKPEQIQTPEAFGTIHLSSFRNSPDVFLSGGGWTSAQKRYQYKAKRKSFVEAEPGSAKSNSLFKDLVAEEVVVTSHDGIQVPLSLIYKKGLQKNSQNPVLIFGYGAYGMSATPFYYLPFLLWASEGGVVAVAHVRGGGEKGDAWHKGGFKQTKPNTWKDAIASAEYLIDEGYTSSGNIAIHGISAGGIMVGRAITERPDLFAAAIPEVGELNPFRSENSPNGANGTKEFGSVQKQEEGLALIEMDAYLNIREGASYPSALVMTGINDPRVVPWQPAKFAARLQASTSSQKPVLFLVDFEGGHGAGVSRRNKRARIADILSFAFRYTGHPAYQD